MSDEILIKEVIAGNNAAFKTLMERYQLLVFRTVMGFVHLKEDAEDITQEVFIRVYQSLHTFQGESEFSTWIYRITVNMSLNFLRSNRKKRLLQSLEALFILRSEEKTPLEELESTERDRRIRKAIDSLPEKQRMAFILSRYEELSQKKIATIMNRSEGAVEQLLQRAKENLQKKLRSAVGK
ncbi:MAG: RNA polymerase sigma factor [Proteiniphilum sp.]|jgi:RNA polymerase sigma-70 factor (ECF subfamily)|nr:RNA polymerase sigma factor [Proteiniphilum sp.]MDD2727036.1 RNA polymerase sigma factor [Proteiniphilum sp.]MDD3332981.1 RNA polymerase sigma factor [Proteiniphilum sp.]MDD3556333.1 RNA polymerase sigma factor [Proteiniphilum sp.]MDD3980091.1 RNA polymerase sigma factor [Proteiniphilum sp.]